MVVKEDDMGDLSGLEERRERGGGEVKRHVLGWGQRGYLLLHSRLARSTNPHKFDY